MNGKDLIILTICAALFAALLLPLRQSMVDDTYIHLQYARNLSEAGELSFNRGEPSYGATSPLWVFILSLVHGMGGELLSWCRALSWFFGLATIVLVYRLSLSIGAGTSAAAAAASITASEAWLVRWSAVGMETSFAVFTVLAVLAVSFTSMKSRARSAVLGLLLFLAVLARPEALLLAPLILFVFALARDRSMPVRLLWLIVFLAAYASWLLAVKGHTGTFLPLTAGAKQGSPVLSLLVVKRALVPVKIMGATLALPWLSVLACVVLGIVRDRSLFSFFIRGGGGVDGPGVNGGRLHLRTGIFLALLWVFALPVVYIIFDFQILSRYLLPAAPAVAVLGVAGLTGITSRLTDSPSLRRAVLIAFTAVVIIQNVVFYFAVVVPPTRDFSRGMQGVLVGMGEWLGGNAESDALVATPDIGAIGYVSRRRILDLGGLVTPGINRMRKTIDVERIVAEGLYLDFGPDYLVDRSEVPERFSGKVIRGVRFETVMQGTVPNLGIRKPEPVVYVLYRLERVEGVTEGED